MLATPIHEHDAGGRSPAFLAGEKTAVTLLCKVCRTHFAFTVEDQARYRERDWKRPRTCPTCQRWRQQPKASRGCPAGLRATLERIHVPLFHTGDPLAPVIEAALDGDDERTCLALYHLVQAWNGRDLTRGE